MRREIAPARNNSIPMRRLGEMTGLVSNLQLPELQIPGPREAAEARVTSLAREILLASADELADVEQRVHSYERSPFISVNKLGAELRTRFARTAVEMTAGRLMSEPKKLVAAREVSLKAAC